MSRILGIMMVTFFGALLILSTVDFSPWSDPAQPAAVHVSPRYIERTIEETGIPNVVTSVLADYRGYDTLFETSVIFTAGVVVILLLRREKKW
ncbi:MAG: hypothetical protein N2572_03675 [Syntrophales bacterium]|nr:hypothetical protein [Syntrophales bacterium]